MSLKKHAESGRWNGATRAQILENNPAQDRYGQAEPLAAGIRAAGRAGGVPECRQPWRRVKLLSLLRAAAKCLRVTFGRYTPFHVTLRP